jgi:hypothetical protein
MPATAPFMYQQNAALVIQMPAGRTDGDRGETVQPGS